MDNRIKKNFFSMLERMDKKMTLNEAKEFTTNMLLTEQKKGYMKIYSSFVDALSTGGRIIGKNLDDFDISFKGLEDNILKSFDDVSIKLNSGSLDFLGALRQLPNSSQIKGFIGGIENSMVKAIDDIAILNKETDVLNAAKKFVDGGSIPKGVPMESFNSYVEAIKQIENLKIHNKVLSTVADMGTGVRGGNDDLVGLFTDALLKNNPDLSFNNILKDIEELRVFSKNDDGFLSDVFVQMENQGLRNLNSGDEVAELLGKNFDNMYKYNPGFFKRMLKPKSMMSADFDAVMKKVSKLDLENTIIVKHTKSNGEEVVSFVEVKNATPEKINIIREQLRRNGFDDITDDLKLKSGGSQEDLIEGVSKGLFHRWKKKMKTIVIIFSLVATDLLFVNWVVTYLICKYKHSGGGYVGDDDEAVKKTYENTDGISEDDMISREEACRHVNYVTFKNTVLGLTIGTLIGLGVDTVEELGDLLKKYLRLLRIKTINKIDEKMDCCYKLNLGYTMEKGCVENCKKGCREKSCGDDVVEEIKNSEEFKQVTDWLENDGSWVEWVIGLVGAKSVEEKKKEVLERWKRNGTLPKEFFKGDNVEDFDINQFVTTMCELSKKMGNVCRVQQIVSEWNDFIDQDISIETCDSAEHRKLFAQQKEMASYIEDGLIVNGDVSEEDLKNVKKIGDLLDKIEVPLKSEEETNGNEENNALKVIKTNMSFIVNREKFCNCLKNPNSEGCGGSGTMETKSKNQVESRPIKQYIDEEIVKEITDGTCQDVKLSEIIRERYRNHYKVYLTNAGYGEEDVEDGLEYIFNVKIPEYCK